jgi:nitrate/nitrite transporter NarK
MLLTESFPADVQATSTAIIESIGQIGGALGPILINFCIQWQIHPMIALSIMALALIVIPFFWMKDPQELSKI